MSLTAWVKLETEGPSGHRHKRVPADAVSRQCLTAYAVAPPTDSRKVSGGTNGNPSIKHTQEIFIYVIKYLQLGNVTA